MGFFFFILFVLQKYRKIYGKNIIFGKHFKTFDERIKIENEHTKGAMPNF